MNTTQQHAKSSDLFSSVMSQDQEKYFIDRVGSPPDCHVPITTIFKRHSFYTLVIIVT